MRPRLACFDASWVLLMTMMMLIVVSAIVGVLACVGIVVIDAMRQRQQRAWQSDYRKRGGLAGALYRRWRGIPRLTYRDED